MTKRLVRSYLFGLGADIVLLACAAAASYYVRSWLRVPGHTLYPITDYLPFMSLLLGSWLVFLHVYGMYGGIDVGNSSEFAKAVFKINYNVLIVVTVVCFGLRITGSNRIMLLCFMVFANLLLVLTRRYRPFVPSNRYAIVGSDEVALKSLQAARKVFPSLHSSFMGFFSPARFEDRSAFPDQGMQVGSLRDMFEAISSDKINTVILALPPDSDQAQEVLGNLRKTEAYLYWAREVPSRIELYPANL
jgi:hypothetical protein